MFARKSVNAERQVLWNSLELKTSRRSAALTNMSSMIIHSRESFRVLMLLMVLFSWSFLAWATPSNRGPPQRRQSARRTQKKATPKKPPVVLHKCSHQTHFVAQKLACNSCHKVPSKNWKTVRTGDAAFPDVADFPEHGSCLNCHREQFFMRQRPAPAICSNCHIAVTPRDTARWLFPSLGDLTDPKLKRREFVSEFGVGFPHDKHIDVVGQLGEPTYMREHTLFITASLQEPKKENPLPVVQSVTPPINHRAIPAKNM